MDGAFSERGYSFKFVSRCFFSPAPPSGEKAVPLSPRAFWALALLALAIIAAPIWTFTELPILDYPAHLVRVTLLSNLPLDPISTRYWTVHLRPVTNLGMDVFVPAIAPLTGPVAGLKLFATLGLTLWIAGAGLLFRGFRGRYDAQALLAAPYAFNAPFTWGFFNFHFGAGLALLGAGFWAMRDRRSFLFLAARAGLSLVVLFCHMMALAVFALLLGGIELGRLFAEGFGLPEQFKLFARASLSFCQVFSSGHFGWSMVPAANSSLTFWPMSRLRSQFRRRLGPLRAWSCQS